MVYGVEPYVYDIWCMCDGASHLLYYNLSGKETFNFSK